MRRPSPRRRLSDDLLELRLLRVQQDILRSPNGQHDKLRRQLDELEQRLRLRGLQLGVDPGLPWQELERRLAGLVERRRGRDYFGPERRRVRRRASDRRDDDAPDPGQ